MKLRRNHGYTLVEMMCSAAVGGLILGVIVLGAAAFQRVFFAADDYYVASEDQMRVMDYIARDLRQSGTGSVTSGTMLTVFVPDYVDYSGSAATTGSARTPTVTVTTPKFGMPTCSISYSGTSMQVNYFRTSGSNSVTVTRQVISTGTANAVVNVDNTDGFILTDANPLSGTSTFTFGGTNSVTSVKTTTSFTPRFHYSNSSSAGTSVYSTIVLRKGQYDTIK